MIKFVLGQNNTIEIRMSLDTFIIVMRNIVICDKTSNFFFNYTQVSLASVDHTHPRALYCTVLENTCTHYTNCDELFNSYFPPGGECSKRMHSRCMRSSSVVRSPRAAHALGERAPGHRCRCLRLGAMFAVRRLHHLPFRLLLPI